MKELSRGRIRLTGAEVIALIIRKMYQDARRRGAPRYWLRRRVHADERTPEQERLESFERMKHGRFVVLSRGTCWPLIQFRKYRRRRRVKTE